MKKRNKTAVLRFVLTFLFVASTLGGNAFAADKLTKIADGVYAYVDTKNSTPQGSYGANAGIVIGQEGVIVIDTLISSKEAQKFIKDIRTVTKKPIKYVVNTHYHLDHAFGNADFKKLGAAIISQSNDGSNMKASAEDALKNAKSYGLTARDIKGTKIAYPSLTFTDMLEIDLGDRKVQLHYAGKSHTSGSIMIYLPESKTLFAGDILFTGYHPFLGEGDIEEWVKVLDYTLAMDVDKIIPGHGPVSGKKDLLEMKEYLIAFDKKAKELALQSNDAQYISAEIVKSLPHRPEGAGLILWNIQMKYLKK